LVNIVGAARISQLRALPLDLDHARLTRPVGLPHSVLIVRFALISKPRACPDEVETRRCGRLETINRPATWYDGVYDPSGRLWHL